MHDEHIVKPSDAPHAFRCSLYECLHRRGDALFELTDAILNAGSVPSPLQLSLAAVHPRLVDLLAALAIGAVGSVAHVRRDISDTLPGVAIAISLVPPLSVVGFTFEAVR